MKKVKKGAAAINQGEKLESLEKKVDRNAEKIDHLDTGVKWAGCKLDCLWGSV